MTTKASATLDDLYSVPEHGKAEIVDGELVVMAPTGFLPGRAGGEIYASLRAYERRMKSGSRAGHSRVGNASRRSVQLRRCRW